MEISTRHIILVAAIIGTITLSSCERKSATVVIAPPVNEVLEVPPALPIAVTSTFETSRLGLSIETFEKVPTEENRSSANLAFAKLDAEIAELEDRVVKTEGTDRAVTYSKLYNLHAYRNAEMLRFTNDQDRLAIDTLPVDSRSVAQKVKDTAEKVGEKVEDDAKKVGRTLNKAAIKTSDAIEDATH